MTGVASPMDFSQVRNGMRARVTQVRDGSVHIKRLQEMGLTVGTVFTVVKIAPFGDPVEIELRGYRLCLRRKEAIDIEIEAVD